MSLARDIEKMIETELALYPVAYRFGRSSKHQYVDLFATDSGSKGRVTFSPGGCQSNLWNTRSHVRRELRRMGCEPLPHLEKKAALGPIGEALIAAAPPQRPTIFLPPPRELEPEASTPEPIAPRVTTLKIERETKPMALPTSTTNGQHKNGSSAPPPAAPTENRFHRLTHSEVVRATLLIHENAKIDHVKRIVVYNDDWSDDRIAAIIRTGSGRDLIKTTHITNLRRENFGQTPAEIEAAAAYDRNRENPQMKDVMDALRDLKSRIEGFDLRLTGVEDIVTAKDSQ